MGSKSLRGDSMTRSRRARIEAASCDNLMQRTSEAFRQYSTGPSLLFCHVHVCNFRLRLRSFLDKRRSAPLCIYGAATNREGGQHPLHLTLTFLQPPNKAARSHFACSTSPASHTSRNHGRQGSCARKHAGCRHCSRIHYTTTTSVKTYVRCTTA